MAFQTLVDTLSDDREFSGRVARFLSLTFLAVAAATSFISYTRDGWLWDSKVSFAPGFLAAIIGVLLVAPLYLRGILRWSKSIYGISSFILLLMVFSAFIELALGGSTGVGAINIGLIAAAVILSWLGIRQVAGLSWSLAAVAATGMIISNNLTVGFAGFIFIACGCLGLILHTGLNPGELIHGLQAEYSPSARLAAARQYEDMRSLTDTIGIPASPRIGANVENR